MRCDDEAGKERELRHRDDRSRDKSLMPRYDEKMAAVAKMLARTWDLRGRLANPIDPRTKSCRRAFAPLALLALLALLGSTPAWAGNGSKPRVPVQWPGDVPCVTTIDKAHTPTLHLAYDFAGPDDVRPTDVTDEVDDSRRHQFFAWCRHRHRDQLLPAWISASDVDRAAVQGLLLTVPGATDVLDLSPTWSTCALRITADQARLPITHQVAAMGVSWDLGPVPRGVYTVEAYTWEPPVNLWTHPSRPGVVRIYDSRVDASPPPAAALDSVNRIFYRDDKVTFNACAAAAPGSVFELAWAPAGLAGHEPVWTTWIKDQPVADQLNLEFPVPSAALVGTATKFLISLTVREAQGQHYVAYSRGEIVVLNADSPSSTDASNSLGSDGSTTSVTSDRQNHGCRVAQSPGMSTLLLVLLGLIGLCGDYLRRRRPGNAQAR